MTLETAKSTTRVEQGVAKNQAALNLQEVIEDRAVSLEVGTLNLEAYEAIYGTSDGDTSSPTGRLAEIRQDTIYGDTEADREVAADEYAETIQALVDDGMELCQAKLVQDLREKDREKYIDLVCDLICDGNGMEAEEADLQATDTFDEIHTDRIQLIKDNGVFTKEDFDKATAGESIYACDISKKDRPDRLLEILETKDALTERLKQYATDKIGQKTALEHMRSRSAAIAGAMALSLAINGTVVMSKNFSVEENAAAVAELNPHTQQEVALESNNQESSISDDNKIAANDISAEFDLPEGHLNRHEDHYAIAYGANDGQNKQALRALLHAHYDRPPVDEEVNALASLIGDTRPEDGEKFGIAIADIEGLSVESEVDMDYTRLLDTIAKGESTGNYNAYYGNVRNQSIDFTSMSVAQVQEWQRNYVNSGSRSSAVGKYQFIQTTLRGLIEELDVDVNTPFDEGLQDRLALTLLERRGLSRYLAGELSRDEFAHNLSQEWAALPRTLGGDPNASYYAGDGLNSAHIALAEVLPAVESVKQDHEAVRVAHADLEARIAQAEAIGIQEAAKREQNDNQPDDNGDSEVLVATGETNGSNASVANPGEQPSIENDTSVDEESVESTIEERASQLIESTAVGAQVQARTRNSSSDTMNGTESETNNTDIEPMRSVAAAGTDETSTNETNGSEPTQDITVTDADADVAEPETEATSEENEDGEADTADRVTLNIGRAIEGARTQARVNISENNDEASSEPDTNAERERGVSAADEINSTIEPRGDNTEEPATEPNAEASPEAESTAEVTPDSDEPETEPTAEAEPAPPAPEQAPKPAWDWPLNIEQTGPPTITSCYGQRARPTPGASTYHRGLDFRAPPNTEVLAIRDGVIVESNYSSAFGHFVIVQHPDGFQSLYAHLNQRAPARHQVEDPRTAEVKQGQRIGLSGNTGVSTAAHLHVEMRRNGESTDPSIHIQRPGGTASPGSC